MHIRADTSEPSPSQEDVAKHSLATLLPERREWSFVAVVVLAALTLIGVIAALPGTEEKAAILIAGQRYEQAIDLLIDAGDRAGLNGHEAFTLTRLYLISGQRDRAVSFLEAELTRLPDSEWALRRLIDLYRASHDFEREATFLRRRFASSLDAPDYRRLLGLYRLTGDYGAERALIAEAAGKNLAAPADLERLAWLGSSEAQIPQATVWTAHSGPFSNYTPNPQLAAADTLSDVDFTSTPAAPTFYY